MRVLFHTYDLAFLRMGGGERVILSLQQALTSEGVRVEIYDPWKHKPEDFDLIHYFSARQCEYWRFHKRFYSTPLVVTPTLASAATTFPDTFVRWMHDRKLKPYFHFPDLLLPTTRREAEALMQRFSVDRGKIKILPNGIEPYISLGDPQLVWQKLRGHLSQPIVLCVGRFEAVKNQLHLLRAIPLCPDAIYIFVGDMDPGNEAYFAECKKVAQEVSKGGKKVHLWPRLEHKDPLLASLYAAARVFVQPSHFETFGIAAMEAYASGCSLALTDQMAAPELFDADYFSPYSLESCATAIRSALRRSRSGGPRPDLNGYTWPQIALQLKSAYTELLSHGSFESS